MPAAPSRCVSFDLDGVIMQGPFGTGVGPRIRAHLRQRPGLIELDPDVADRRIRADIIAAHHAHLRTGDLVGAWNWDALYAEVNTTLGGGDLPRVVDLIEECCAQEGMVALLPGVREGLARLRGVDIGIVAITNGYSAYQWPVLRALGVADCFSQVLAPDVAGAAKPDPRIFAAVPRLAAHVGDALIHDVFGAHRAGLRAIWLDAGLPEQFRGLSAEARPRAAGFRDYVAEQLATSFDATLHPEADVAGCVADAVVTDVDEAARVLLGWLGR